MKVILLSLSLFTFGLRLNAAPICQDVQGALIYDSTTTVGKTTAIINPRMKTSLGEAHIFTGSTASVVSLNPIIEGICQAFKFDRGVTIGELRKARKGEPLVTLNVSGIFTSLLSTPIDGEYDYVQSVTCVKFQ